MVLRPPAMETCNALDVVPAQLLYDFDDSICGALIVFLASDVIQRITFSIA